MGDNETTQTEQPTPQGSVTRLPKGALAPESKQRAKKTGLRRDTVKTAKTTTPQRGRRSGVEITGKPKRPYTRRIQTTTTSTSPISALLRANGFTSAATIEVHEGRKRLAIPVGLLP